MVKWFKPNSLKPSKMKTSIFTTICCLGICIFIGTVQAQNLVPNPSFEEFTDCPADPITPALASNWSPLRGTPDYFNSCDETGLVSVPFNEGWGYQPALSGNGYGGLIGISYNNNREILGTQLSETLVIGTDYYVEFYWSRTFGGGFHANCDCANSHLGALFTNQDYDNIENPIEYGNFAHIFDPTLHADSANWVKVSGWFTADSAYSHLAIGNFFDLELNDTAYYNGSPNEILLKTYYYIENVCVSTDPDFCDLAVSAEDMDTESGITIYPNPTTGIFTLKGLYSKSRITVVNFQGMEVPFQKLSENTFSLVGLPQGIYLITIYHNNHSFTRKLLKTQ
jgi:hypothetical protein